MAATVTARPRLLQIMTWRRFHRSVRIPATGPRTSCGAYSAPSVSPVAASDLVANKMCAGTARTSSHEPM
jgi:hypothetical protein